jgi:hypothetical protein
VRQQWFDWDDHEKARFDDRRLHRETDGRIELGLAEKLKAGWRVAIH